MTCPQVPALAASHSAGTLVQRWGSGHVRDWLSRVGHPALAEPWERAGPDVPVSCCVSIRGESRIRFNRA